MRIPQDLSVVGFDDIELAQYYDPPLTTVAQPRFAIGREAMLLLLDELQGKRVNNGSRLLDAELRVRGSTAPAAKRENECGNPAFSADSEGRLCWSKFQPLSNMTHSLPGKINTPFTRPVAFLKGIRTKVAQRLRRPRAFNRDASQNPQAAARKAKAAPALQS